MASQYDDDGSSSYEEEEETFVKQQQTTRYDDDVSLDSQGRPYEDDGEYSVDSQGRPYVDDDVSVDSQGRPYVDDDGEVSLDSQGRPYVDDGEVSLDSQGRPYADDDAVSLDSQGRPYADDDAVSLDSQGRPYADDDAVSLDSQGRPYADDGEVSLDSQGRPYADDNVSLDSQGRPYADDNVSVDSKGVPYEAEPAADEQSYVSQEQGSFHSSEGDGIIDDYAAEKTASPLNDFATSDAIDFGASPPAFDSAFDDSIGFGETAAFPATDPVDFNANNSTAFADPFKSDHSDTGNDFGFDQGPPADNAVSNDAGFFESSFTNNDDDAGSAHHDEQSASPQQSLEHDEDDEDEDEGSFGVEELESHHEEMKRAAYQDDSYESSEHQEEAQPLPPPPRQLEQSETSDYQSGSSSYIESNPRIKTPYNDANGISTNGNDRNAESSQRTENTSINSQQNDQLGAAFPDDTMLSESNYDDSYKSEQAGDYTEDDTQRSDLPEQPGIVDDYANGSYKEDGSQQDEHKSLPDIPPDGIRTLDRSDRRSIHERIPGNDTNLSDVMENSRRKSPGSTGNGRSIAESAHKSVRSSNSRRSSVSGNNGKQKSPQGGRRMSLTHARVSPKPSTSKPDRRTTYHRYSREQMMKVVMANSPLLTDENGGAESPKAKSRKRRQKINMKSESLLTFVRLVTEASEIIEGDADQAMREAKDSENMTSVERLVQGFEALVGILLQSSDELELMSTFAKHKDTAAIGALKSLLGFDEVFLDIFDQLKPILEDLSKEEINEEMNDFLYGMNLTVDLLCDLSHLVEEKQVWNARANTSYVTLIELLNRDILEVVAIFDDIDTPDYEVTVRLQSAWTQTGHLEEFKTLQVTEDLEMFRQLCYEVVLSTDQWCPDTNILMDVCGIDPTINSPNTKGNSSKEMARIPEPAVHVLEKMKSDGVPRLALVASVLRRILPPHAFTDVELIEKYSNVRPSVRNPLGSNSSKLVAITSVAEDLNDPASLGVAGVGKTTLAAMVAQHGDVRRYFVDGIAWIHVGEQEFNYVRYIQCLRDLIDQLGVPEEEEPLFPELLHTPGESKAKRRRREEGFMIYVREIMVEFLQYRNVLIILDDVCFEPDLDWFDFDPAPPEEPEVEEEFACVVLVTSRCTTLLPTVDTVEVDMLAENEAVSLFIKESGELSKRLIAESPETRSVVVECANHPLAVKSVARWLHLKHATAEVASSVNDLHEDIAKSMDRILKNGNREEADMMFEILNMSLSPAINGEPTKIIKLCFAAFVLVFCEKKHLSDFALADSTPIVPLGMAEMLFESLLELEEEALMKDGNFFFEQKKDAALVISEALIALGVFKVIETESPNPSANPEDDNIEKQVQIMHKIQQEYGEYLNEEEYTLQDLTRDAEQRWNRALSLSFMKEEINWDAEVDDVDINYSLEMLPCHMIRGGLFNEAAALLTNSGFVKGRLFALGREDGSRRHIKDCETLYEAAMEARAAGRKKFDVKQMMKSAYQVLGSLLNMDEDEYIAEEGSPEAVEVARAHFEIGFSLAEKRCWDAAISHWDSSQELFVSSLGMVEVVAGLLYNVGVVYSDMNEYEQALGSLKQCLRIRGAIHGEEHILYAHTIQKIGDIFLSMSDYHEAMESYNWALDVMHIEPSHHRIDIGDILENMGNIHYSKGEIDEALQCYQDALRSKQVDLGDDHPELASTYHYIGNCLSDQGRTQEAISRFEEAIRLKQLDPDGGGERDSDVLTIQGVLHNLHGRPNEGLACYEKSLQILVTKVPHKKEKVASLLHLIGCVYLMSGEHKKAMKLFEESLQARRKVLGFVHLDVASTLFNMAFLHQTRNRLDKALKCLEEALKIRQLRLPDSEKVAVTHEKIGTLARSIGKSKKAENAFTDALRIRKLIHGENHEKVATVLQELGDLMDDLGEFEDAMRYYGEALDIRHNRLGPDDLAVAETLYSMGFTLQNNDASERALQCFEESLHIRKFQLGENAKEVGDTLNMMGFLQVKRGEYDVALELLWHALRIRKLQDDHIKVSETLKNIGNVHKEKQEHELAVECYEECLRIRRSELGEEHERVADALIALGHVYGDMELQDEAMRCYKEALAIRSIVYGDQDDSIAAVLQYMGSLEFRAGDYESSMQLLTESVRIRQQNKTKNDGDYVNVLFMIGNIHKMQDREEEAQKCWTEAFEVFQDLGLAEGNPQIAQLMNTLMKDSNLDEMPEHFQEKFKQPKGPGMFGRLAGKMKGGGMREDKIGINRSRGRAKGHKLKL